MLRRLARSDPDVNEEWNCDKGRFAFAYVREGDRITRPLIRDADGELEPASWTDGHGRRGAAADATARDDGGVGVLTGGRLTVDGRLRLREVRPGRPAHQRHRLPGPGALAPRRRSSWRARVAGTSPDARRR